MLALVLGLLAPVQLVSAPDASAAGGPTFVAAGTITTSATWSPEGSPYVLKDSVRVGPGATLTVLPGTVVKLMPTPNSAYNYTELAISGGQLLASCMSARRW